MRQLRPRGLGNELLGHQALQLLGHIGRGVRRVLGVLELTDGSRVFDEDGARQPGHLVGNQRQAAPAFFHSAFEGRLVGGQRVEQKSAVQGHVDDLGTQLFLRAQRHIGHSHLLQVGDVLFKVLERVLDLQRKQATQTRTVLGGRHLRLVENLDGDRITAIDQRREAHQRLSALFDFHEFGQLTKRPGGVALARRGCWRRSWCRGIFCYVFNSCLRFTFGRWSRFLL